MFISSLILSRNDGLVLESGLVEFLYSNGSRTIQPITSSRLLIKLTYRSKVK